MGTEQISCDKMRNRPSVRKDLEDKERMYTTMLANVKMAIDALDANPEVNKFLELLEKAGSRL
jgi:formaldehyde-activating enzyme involved in methanogenesis